MLHLTHPHPPCARCHILHSDSVKFQYFGRCCSLSTSSCGFCRLQASHSPSLSTHITRRVRAAIAPPSYKNPCPWSRRQRQAIAATLSLPSRLCAFDSRLTDGRQTGPTSRRSSSYLAIRTLPFFRCFLMFADRVVSRHQLKCARRQTRNSTRVPPLPIVTAQVFLPASPNLLRSWPRLSFLLS